MKPHEWTVAAHDDSPLYFETTRSIEEWARRHREPGEEEHTTTVRYSDPYDDGVIDEWSMMLEGFPIVPVAQRQSHWEVATEQRIDVPALPSADVVIMPMNRRYFASKSDGRLLQVE